MAGAAGQERIAEANRRDLGRAGVAGVAAEGQHGCAVEPQLDRSAAVGDGGLELEVCPELGHQRLAGGGEQGSGLRAAIDPQQMVLVRPGQRQVDDGGNVEQLQDLVLTGRARGALRLDQDRGTQDQRRRIGGTAGSAAAPVCNYGMSYFSSTYEPGASVSGGCFLLPTGGGVTFLPERSRSQESQSVHQLPSCVVAASSHAWGDVAGSSLTQ